MEFKFVKQHSKYPYNGLFSSLVLGEWGDASFSHYGIRKTIGESLITVPDWLENAVNIIA